MLSMLSLKMGIFYCDAAMPTVLARRTKEESRSTALKGVRFWNTGDGFPDKNSKHDSQWLFSGKTSMQQDFQSWNTKLGDLPWNIPQLCFERSFLNNSPCSFRTSRVPLRTLNPPKSDFIKSDQPTATLKAPFHLHKNAIPPEAKPAKNLRLYGESYSWNSNSCLWIYVLLYLGCLCAGSMVRLRYLGTNGKGSRTSSKCCGWEQLGTSATRFVRLFSWVKLAEDIWQLIGSLRQRIWGMGDPRFFWDHKTSGFSLKSTICVLGILECQVGYFLVAWYSQWRSTPALQILLLDSASSWVSCNHKSYFWLILIESCVPSDGHFRMCCWESMQMLYGRSPCEPFTTAFSMRHLWGGLDSSRDASFFSGIFRNLQGPEAWV